MTFSFQIWNAIDHGASPAALTCSRPQIYRGFMIFQVKKQNITYREKMHLRIVVRKSFERKLIKIRSQQSTSNNLPHVTSQCVNSRRASPMCYVRLRRIYNEFEYWKCQAGLDLLTTYENVALVRPILNVPLYYLHLSM